MVHINGGEQFLWGLLAVDELALGDRAGVQNPVPVSEIIEAQTWASFSVFLSCVCVCLCVWPSQTKPTKVWWITSAWSLRRGSCWGILSCRSWCLPARRYSAAGAGPGGGPWTLHGQDILFCFLNSSSLRGRWESQYFSVLRICSWRQQLVSLA